LHLHPIVRLEGLRWAASCARHCAQFAQRKSGGLCAALHTDCATEELQTVRDSAHRLRNRRAADRALHCAQTARRKSYGPYATVRTVCTRIVRDIMRGMAHGLHDGRTADCARHCATEERRLCAFADFLAARIGGDSVTHQGPVPRRKRPLL
jgi:hypothetical protein